MVNSFAALIPLLFLLVIVAGLIVGIVLWSKSGSRPGSGEMACGRCGYQVRGLEQLNCPECGADLREVGIRRGGSSGQRTAGIVLTCVCGGLLFLGCGCMSFAFADFKSSQSIQLQQAQTQIQTSPSNTVTSSEPLQSETDHANDTQEPDATPSEAEGVVTPVE